MIRLGIRFDVKDYRRWLTAVRRVDKITLYEAKNLPRRCSIEFYQLVHQNIVRQRYAGGYAGYYNKRYAEWKAKVRPGSGYWRLFDELLNSLTSFKVRGGNVKGKRVYAWMGGVPNTVISSGGKSWLGLGDRSSKRISVAKYGKMMEYGGSYGRAGTHPKRPVFVPTTKQYSKRKFKKQFKKSWKKIKDEWK